MLASRIAQIAPPIDGVTQEFTDLSVVDDDSQLSRAMGFGVKLLHPRQLEPALLAFLPSPTRLHARSGFSRLSARKPAC